MRHKKILTALLMILPVNIFAQTYIEPGDVSGSWTVNGSPYYIQGDITIPDDSTLIIEPGVSIIFEDYYGLNVQGRLLAVGNESDTIFFTVADTTGFYNPDITSGGWNGIQFIDTPPENDTSKIIFCTLQYGKAVDTIQPGNMGGAVYVNNSSKIIISNCQISYNSAGGSDAPSGGGICLFSADIILTGNVLSHNTASDGGAILIYDSDPVFTGNTIEYNTAGHGGGVWVGGESGPVFNGDVISNNTAPGNGGGIICWQGTNVVLNSVTLNNNTANYGGAISVSDCEIQINGCSITDNSSSWIGGGINAFSSTIDINNTEFERDTAYIFGGAMGIYYSELNLSNSNLNYNSSRVLGGGIHSDYSTLNITNTVFERDSVGGNPEGGAGGGIFTWHCSLVLDDCEFVNDSASSSGGAIASDSSAIIINNTSFTQNSAIYNGGAISLGGGSIDISSSDFTQNSAMWGGSIISNNSDIDIRDCMFNENSSEHGAGLSVGWCTVELNKVSFDQNTSVWGGGISATNCNLLVDSCLFTGNTVSGDAGAIECIVDTANFREKVSIQITNSDFINNSAENLYGGVEIRQENSDTSLCSVMMDKNIFRENSAYSYSAVRFIGSIDDIEVGNSIFENNHVTQPTSIFSANGGAKVKVYNTVFAKNYPRAASLNVNSRIDFINCSFIGNWGSERSALSLRNNAEATVTNSIFWDNGNNIFSLITVGGNGNTLTINYSDLQYGPDSIYVSDSISVVNWGAGNITSYPEFADTLNNDFHLQDNSPCLAAGIDSIEVSGMWLHSPSTDIEGHPRPSPEGSMPDMGAYESQYPVGNENDVSAGPAEYAIYQNYPNPFNPTTRIKYQVPVTTKVRLVIYNVLGSEIATLMDAVKPAGFYELVFDGSELSSGVYFYRLEANPVVGESTGFTGTRKMILVK